MSCVLFIFIFLFLLDHCSGDGTASVAATFVALHIASHAEGFPAPGMCTAEGLLAGMAVGVNSQARGSREGLVACAADISVMVLLVGCVG